MSLQTPPTRFLRSKKRFGIAFIVVVIIVVVIIAGGAGIYVLVLSSPGGAGAKVPVKTTTTTTTPAGSDVKNYAGTFSYSLPLGPTGSRLNKDNVTVSTYGTVLSVSGSFTFSIASFNKTGTGKGKGTMIATTSGYCTGKTTFDYTFDIINANPLFNGNTTVAFGQPTPANGAVQLTCSDANGQISQTTGSFTYLSVYPNLISVASVPANIVETQPGNITYQVHITSVP